MARQSREAVQDAALVQLLRALPEERLDGILIALGVTAEKAVEKLDPRHCQICGQQWLKHKRLVELEGDDPHAWEPWPPSRSGV